MKCWPAVAAAVALLAVAGCARNPPKPEVEPEPTDVTEQPPLPLPKPNIPVRRAPAPAVSHTRPNPAGPAAAPGPDIALLGLSQDEVKAILGEPASQSGQGTAQSWVYRAAHCTLELTFFFDVSRNNFYALDRHVDGVPDGEGEAQLCLKEIHGSQEPKL